MRAIALIPVIMMLSFGCLGAPPAQQEAPLENLSEGNGAAPTPATCLDYCRTLPHIQCVGQWNVSGTYPDCACSFECDVSSVPEPEPAAPEVPEQPVPDEPLATPTDKSPSELMDDALENLSDGFYRTHDGAYTERTYRWERRVPLEGGLAYDLAPISDVLFDGEEIRSILASGFVSFEEESTGAETALGVAIFNESRTMLDGYTGDDAFSVDYFPDLIDRKLRDCWIKTKDYNVDKDGGWLLSYYFECEKVYEK